MIPINEAKQKILASCKNKFAISELPLSESIGHSIAEDVFADRDYPPFNRATMDGYAIYSQSFNNQKKYQIEREHFAGQEPGKLMDPHKCIKIMTGAAVPEGADLVVPIEDTEFFDGFVQFKIEKAQTWKNIALKGEDKNKGDLVVEKNSEISPFVLSILASLGKSTIKVFKKPSVAIISTGDEVVPVDVQPKDYQIRDSNSYSIEAFLKNYDIKPEYRTLVQDNKQELKNAITKSLEKDIIIISGGVSMGDADFVPDVLSEVGFNKIFHKVNIKPGKPLWFGEKSETVVFGVPGNPVSVQVIFKIFIEPYIREYMGMKQTIPIKLKLTKEHIIKGLRDFYFPATISVENNETVITPQSNKGSGDIKALYNSHGLGFHPGDITTLKKGEIIDFLPWSPLC